jgi:hypothetical protein
MKKLFIVLFVLLSSYLYSATITSTTSGLWSNPATWNSNSVPGCGDSIIILAIHTVTVSNQLDYRICTSSIAIDVKGHLYFINGKKLRLPCNGRVYIRTGAIMDSDGSGNSNLLEICNTTYWDGSQGPVNGPYCYPVNCAVLLPITLINFTGYYLNYQVHFNFATATELNSDYFLIQRSYDGINFTDVTKIKSRYGNSYSRIDYTAVDIQPGTGYVYYRLLQYDNDKTFVVSKLIVVEVKIEHITYVYYDLLGNIYHDFADLKTGIYIAISNTETKKLIIP